MKNYSPPRRRNLPHSDLNYAIQNNWPVLIAADLNARHSMFGYSRNSNPKGRQLNKIVFDNKLNYIGPGFPTYFCHNNRQGTKPDIVLTNNKFYFNFIKLQIQCLNRTNNSLIKTFSLSFLFL